MADVTLPAGFTQAQIQALIDSSISGKQNVRATYDSGNQTISNGGALALEHLLGGVPKRLLWYIKCINAEGANGFALGDEVPVAPNAYAISKSFQADVSATHINVKFAAAAAPFSLLDKATGVHNTASVADWVFIVRAER